VADLNPLRSAIESIANKLNTLRTAIDRLREIDVQDEIDELQVRVEEIGATIDQLIADAQSVGTGGTTPGEGETPEEPPTATQLPA